MQQKRDHSLRRNVFDLAVVRRAVPTQAGRNNAENEGLDLRVDKLPEERFGADWVWLG
jgi:hypothetical protein